MKSKSRRCKISVFTDAAEKLEAIAEYRGTTVAEVVSSLALAEYEAMLLKRAKLTRLESADHDRLLREQRRQEREASRTAQQKAREERIAAREAEKLAKEQAERKKQNTPGMIYKRITEKGEAFKLEGMPYLIQFKLNKTTGNWIKPNIRLWRKDQQRWMFIGAMPPQLRTTYGEYLTEQGSPFHESALEAQLRAGKATIVPKEDFPEGAPTGADYDLYAIDPPLWLLKWENPQNYD